MATGERAAVTMPVLPQTWHMAGRPRRVGVSQARRLMAQERAIFSGQTPSPFCCQVVLELTGPLDPDVLQRTLDQIVDRHDSLRASFHAADTVPSARVAAIEEFASTRVVPAALYAQHIHRSASVPLRTCSVEHPSREQFESEIWSLARQEAATAFDYTTPPLMRALLVRHSAARHVLILAASHLVADAPSMAVVQRDFEVIYAGLCQGSPATTLPAPMQFPDFVDFQHDALTTGGLQPAFERLAQRWNGVAGCQLTYKDLPFASGSPRVPSPLSSDNEEIVLDEPFAQGIRALAKRSRTTPYVIATAVFAAVLREHLDRSRFTMWVPFSTRGRILIVARAAGAREMPDPSSAESMVGWCVNPHALDVNLSGVETGHDVIAQVRASVELAAADQDVPLAWLWWRIGECLETADLRVICDAHPWMPESETQAGPLQIRRMVPRTRSLAQHDLRLTVLSARHHLIARILYDPGRFSPDTARRLLESWRATLAALAADPAAPVRARRVV